MKRNTQYIPVPTQEEGQEIIRLNNLFYANDHDLLNGGRMKKKDKDTLETLYYKFFNKIDNHDWSKDLLTMELDNLKKDFICKKNTNKKHWSMSILLNWVNELPTNADEQLFYYALSSRESYQRVLKFAYKG